MAENDDYGSLLDDNEPLLEERITVEETGENSEAFLEEVSGITEPCYLILEYFL